MSNSGLDLLGLIRTGIRKLVYNNNVPVISQYGTDGELRELFRINAFDHLYIGDANPALSSATVLQGKAAVYLRSAGIDQIVVTPTAIGFYNVPPVARPSLTYSRTGETAANAQLRTALASLGLVADNTVA